MAVGRGGRQFRPPSLLLLCCELLPRLLRCLGAGETREDLQEEAAEALAAAATEAPATPLGAAAARGGSGGDSAPSSGVRQSAASAEGGCDRDTHGSGWLPFTATGRGRPPPAPPSCGAIGRLLAELRGALHGVIILCAMWRLRVKVCGLPKGSGGGSAAHVLGGGRPGQSTGHAS